MERSVLAPLRLGALAAVLAVAAAVVAAQIVGPAHATPTELFFSEYVEGSSSNKALEVYNGTGAPVTLTGSYDVQVFANGSATATATIPLTGTVADGDVFVLAQVNAVAAVLAQADQTTSNFLYNGNDAVALRHGGVVIDAIGQIGLDPGVEWGAGAASTADNTLRRKPTVQAGDANGSDAFDPTAEWDGFPLDSFDGLGSHTISTGGGGGTNQAPEAADDAAAVDEDSGENAIDVLANDLDLDGDVLAVTSVTDAANGSVAIAPGGGSLTYAPDVDFNGDDFFTYTVSDGRGGSDTATVSVAIDPVDDDPDPEDDAGVTAEDEPVTVDVLANDLDVDGDVLVVSDVDEAEHGTTSVSADGRVVYEPEPNFNGTDAFEYVVSDGGAGLATGDVLMTVTPVNDPPDAVDDRANVAKNRSIVIDVLANDSPGPADEASQQLQVDSVGPAANGVAELVTAEPDLGKVRYTPNAGYVGSDSFTYVVSDGVATAVATVRITVRQPGLGTICGLTPTILGTRGDDAITGTPGDDVIRSLRGNDVIDGNGGHDLICAGPGADQITTAGGDDGIAAGSGRDTIVSGSGHDRVRGGFGHDEIRTGAGDDGIAAGPGDDDADAGDGKNSVKGGAGDDRIRAGSGDDRIDGGPGTDSCDPGGGRNTLKNCE